MADASPPPPQHEHADRVCWPINRLSYQEPTPAELAAVAALFASRDDAPLLVRWVLEHSPAANRFRTRLVVVSAFRVWLLRRSRRPLGARLVRCRELQLLHVRHLRVLQSATTTTSLQVLVADAPALHIDAGAHAESVVRLLQRLLHALRLVFPDNQFPTVALPPQCHWEEFVADVAAAHPHPSRRRRHELADDMKTAYRAFCDTLDVPYRASVTARLAECAGASVDLQYCLAVPPGVDGYQQQQPASLWRHLGLAASSSAAATAATRLREVQALARTLEHCHCFDGVFVYDLALNDEGLAALFQALLSPRSAIQGLTLTNVNLTARALRVLQRVVLQSTVKRGPPPQSLPLRRLDVSFNRFSPAMASELATTLELLPSALEALQLEQCALAAASSWRVLRAVKANPAFAAALRELNVSGNRLDAEGSRELANWLSGAFALQRLDVSQTALCTTALCLALRQNSLLHESSLRVLDVSYNRMRSQASTDLGYVLGRTQSLATLFLRGMQRRAAAWRPVQLLLQSPRRVHSSSAGLRKLHLQRILAPMFRNTGRALPCLVDLSENDLRGRKAALLAELIDDAPVAGRASLRLDHTQLHDRSSILLLHALRSCRALASLSLEGNGFVKRKTRRSVQRFHAGVSSALPGPPSALEAAAASALALLLGVEQQRRRRADLALHAPLPLRELCLKSEAPMVFGAHVIAAAVDALALNQRLQVLDVSGNECGDVLAGRLGAALRTNRSLQVLFWDGNFTTVDGLRQFYDGLLLNPTLVMVQMPIKDTRRILEEQKDPPREKLFSVLGKIFKATERNQATTRDAERGRKRGAARRRSTGADDARRVSLALATGGSDAGDNQHDVERELLPMQRKTDSAARDGRLGPEGASLAESSDAMSSPACGDEKDALDLGEEDSDDADALPAPSLSPETRSSSGAAVHWGDAGLSGSTNARYPSTMNSWSRASRADLLRSSWTELSALRPAPT
ncbi:hypothetical protein PybrP1_002951 [[Pythium] brassicae (nom. inval.)]|nr:hypothetical protein PybrP1_002951 [[Pythium] brassicae (nom. inval.)]